MNTLVTNLGSSNKTKARIAVEIIVAIIAAVALIITAIIAASVSVYQTRHSDTSLSAGATANLTFQAASTDKSQGFTISPYSGTLYVSGAQTSGETFAINQYKFKYKKASSSTYTSVASWYAFYNNVYSSETKCGSVASGTKYNMLVQKTNGYDKQSALTVDWLLK